LRPELRKNKEIERFRDSRESGNALVPGLGNSFRLHIGRWTNFRIERALAIL
jgi:hypothetical protein